MARSYQDVQALKAAGEVKQVESEVQGLPPGYISGGDLTLTSDDTIDVDPLILNIKGKQVTIDSTYTIVDGDFVYSRVAGCTYTVYLDDAGLFHIDPLESEYDPNLHAYYHPTESNYRSLGKFHIDDDNVIDYAFPSIIRKIAVTDNEDRYVEISAEKGLYAEDGAGNIIHDIPDAAVTANEFYLGHISWFYDHSSYKIYDVVNPPLTTWTSITCLTSGNTNVKGAIIKVYAYSLGTAAAQGYTLFALRPQGTSWSADTDSATPMAGGLVGASDTIIAGVRTYGFLMCPIGTDNEIQFYFNCAPIDGNDRLIILQLGVII